MSKLDKFNDSAFLQGSSKVGNKEVLDFSFVNSNTLKAIEEGMKTVWKVGVKVQLSICLALYQIEEQGLYQELGHTSFSEYLKQERILPRSTAYEYYYIGKYWTLLEEDLKKIGFTEEDGLTKLKVFPKKIMKEDKKAILEHLKSDTFNEFKRFIKNLYKREDGLKITEQKNLPYVLTDKEISMADEIISYINSKKKSANTVVQAGISQILDMISFLTDKEVFDKKLYNLIIEETK